MPSNKESAQSLKRPAPPPALPRLPVFPPLPPLPPPDTNKWIEPTRKASPLPPALTRSEPRPRRFGTKITNLLSAGDGISVVHKADHKSTSSVALAAAQKYYHQYQHSSHPGKKPCIADKLEGENYETKPEHVIKEFIPKMTPMQPGHTIWSVTPDELTALAKEVAAMKKESAEPVKTLSYAEASKRNIPRFAESRASQEMKAVEDEQPERTFKKYYALPIIPSYESSRSRDIYHAATLEEKEESFQDRTGPSTEDKSAFALDQNQMSSLSATTATFYPRQTTEPNDLIQLVNIYSWRVQ